MDVWVCAIKLLCVCIVTMCVFLPKRVSVGVNQSLCGCMLLPWMIICELKFMRVCTWYGD